MSTSIGIIGEPQLSTQDRKVGKAYIGVDEAQARVHYALKLWDSGLRGTDILTRLQDKFSITIESARKYLKLARELEQQLCEMGDAQTSQLCHRNFMRLMRHDNPKISLVATRELAKFRGLYKAQKIEISTPYDNLPPEELTEILQIRGLS